MFWVPRWVPNFFAKFWAPKMKANYCDNFILK